MLQSGEVLPIARIQPLLFSGCILHAQYAPQEATNLSWHDFADLSESSANKEVPFVRSCFTNSLAGLRASNVKYGNLYRINSGSRYLSFESVAMTGHAFVKISVA
jgi:hypothetical protein